VTTLLAAFDVPSRPGNERLATRQVSEAIAPLALPRSQIERLSTAVAEATMNAMEHGNKYQEDLPVTIQVLGSGTAVIVRITDHGADQPIPEPETPDLEAKLAGLQGPRGWGLFLIKHMCDEMRIESDDSHHTVELVVWTGGNHGAGAA
jgi:anti-sigma regulatory factor (Ser/Thr protein kinase)